MKILHIIHTMEMGGIQKWVASLAQAKRPAGVEMDVLYMRGFNEVIISDIKRGGCKVIGPAPSAFNPIQLYLFFKKIQKEYGPYQVVHGHLYYNAGVVLGLWKLLRVPIRILHIHSMMNRVDIKLTWKKWRWWLQKPILGLIKWTATHRLAVSKDAGQSMFGKTWGVKKGDAVVPPGIMKPKLINNFKKNKLRQEFGIPQGAKIIGHIGRLVEIKNQQKILEACAELIKKNQYIWVIIVGDGPLLINLQSQATELGIAERVVWTGSRSDATDILQLFDVMMMPSFSESFGLSVAEAMACGIPIVASTGVSEEVFSSNLVWYQRIDLKCPLHNWQTAILNALAIPKNTHHAVKKFNTTNLSMNKTINELYIIYNGMCES